MSESKASYKNLVHGIRAELQESIYHLALDDRPAQDRINAAYPHLLQANEHVGRLISYLERVWRLMEASDGTAVSKERLGSLLERIHHHPDRDR
jgi:hypothetical protein